MPTANLYATALASGSVSTSGNALGAPDGVFTTDTGNTSWTARFTMDSVPAGAFVDGTQTVKVRVRRDSDSGSDPSVTAVRLFVSGSLVANLLSSSVVPSSTTPQDITVTFTAAQAGNGDAVSIEVVTSGGSGGTTVRRSVQMDAITWEASYVVDDPAVEMSAWNGTAWVVGSLYRWDGSRWRTAQLKRWNGTGWVEVT
jgi:hypothetical protein